MKRFLRYLVMSLMMFALIACGNNQETGSNVQPTESQSEEVESEMGTQETETETEEEQVDKCWVKNTVNFRNAPGMNSEVIRQLTSGTELVKLAQEGVWVQVRYGEEIGYVHKDYVSRYIPANTLEGEVYIIVKKSERTLELWQGKTLIISEPIGLGFSPVGHKQVEGDGKTPEGEYYVCVRNYQSAYYLSLGVSYPNKVDAAAALADGRINNATYESIANAIDNGECPNWYTPLGGAIMIHGEGSSSDWTAGCIGVENDVMDILFEYCPVRTRITILP